MFHRAAIGLLVVTMSMVLLVLTALGAGLQSPSELTKAPETDATVSTSNQTGKVAASKHDARSESVAGVGLESTNIQVPHATGAPANYQILTQCIGSGGGVSSSTSFHANATAGQSTIGEGSSESYKAGVGYWYGVSGGGGGGCDCPSQVDLNGDGFIDSVDLSLVIDIVFFGGADVTDPLCPTSRGDFNNDGFADSVDLSLLIDYVFFGGPGPADPCAP